MHSSQFCNQLRTCSASLSNLRRALVLVLGLLLTQGCASTAENGNAGESSDGAAASVEQHVSDSGHAFWYYSMPDADRTAVAVTWTSELPDETLMHVATPRVGIDLMLNGGAGGQAPEDIIADFEDLDSGSRLWVQPREISGFLVSPEEHMQRAAEIANQVLTQPNLDEDWFARELKILSDGAKDRETIVAGLAWNLAREMSLGDHPYKRFWSLRPVDEISAISLDNVRAWHQQAFSTEGMSVTAAGNATAKKVGAEIDRVLLGMKAKPTGTQRDFPKPQLPAKTIVLHQPDAPKSVILIMGNLPPHSAGNDLAVQLGVGVLGHGKQSRLFKTVRSGLRAAYGFGAGQFNMTRDHKLLHMSGEVETAKLQAALNETRSAYEKLRTGGVGVVEFPIAKRFYKQQLVEEFSKPESVAYLMMEYERNGLDINQVPGLLAAVGGLSRAEVNRVIREAFPVFDSLLKIVVTPDANAIEEACVITDIDDWASCT
ncbi:MAG: insulinase family protein [Granulosicoccus sp.]|nr:insulinase family protein [Granulosicoccus sp.]